jgi:hypothetical protein
VVVGRLACHVGVLATRQIDPLDGVQIGEQVEGPEDGCPTDAESTSSRIGHEVGRREVGGPSRDQLRDRSPCVGRSIAGAAECGADGHGIGHGRQMILSLS